MILIFSGRKHHKDKLQPVFDALSKDGDVRWLITNNAINIDPPLMYTNPSGQPFVHAYMQMRPGDDDVVDRVVEKTLRNMPLVPGVAPWWQVYSVREAAELVVSYRNVIEQAKAIIILHSNNFFAKPLAYLAQERNIPVFAFQEGVLRDRDQGTMNKQASAGEYVDKLFVWSNTAKKQYIAAGLKSNQIVVSGPMHLDKYINMSREEAQARTGNPNPTVLFVPTLQEEYVGDIAADARFLHKFSTQLGFNFLFRPHPFELEAGVYGNLPNELNTFNAPENLICCRNGNTIIVGQHSTIMLEAVTLGAVVIEYQERGLDILHPLAPKAALSATKETFPNMLATIEEHIAQFDTSRMQKFIRDEFGDNLGRATETVVKEIKKSL
jgi:hypothetical protein